MSSKGRSAAARAAWTTRRSPPHRAAKSERLSKGALEAWAKERGFHLVLLDAPSGKPRTGIVDALLVRHRRSSADAFEAYAVQLKGGQAGITPQEVTRLKTAAGRLAFEHLVVLHDMAGGLHFYPSEPAKRG